MLCAFDSWVWVQLTAARLDPDHPLRQTWERLVTACDDGMVQVALTSGNYLELWNRSDAESRRRVAITMAGLSGYVTLRAVHEVATEETARLITARRVVSRGRGEPIPRDWIIGMGARHAFGSPTGRFRFVESLATATEPEGDELAPPQEWLDALDGLSPAQFEWINLAGLDRSHDLLGIEYRPTHREGDEWVRAQQALRQAVAAIDSDESLLYRGLILSRLDDVFGEDKSGHLLDHEVRAWFTGPIAGVSFITALPVQQVFVELLYAAHRNLAYTFRQHDRVDLQDLALAIPYCDVVVPDRHWAHLATASRVAREHGTVVLKGRDQFRAWAESL